MRDRREAGERNRREKQAVSAIPRESGAFYERPKRMGVKRRAKTERPEPALSERSEFEFFWHGFSQISKGLEFLPPQPWFKTFIFLRVPFETIKKLPFPNNEENDSFSKSICQAYLIAPSTIPFIICILSKQGIR